MKYLINLLILFLLSCTEATNTHESVQEKDDSKEEIQKKNNPPCKSKLMKLEDGEEFESLQCEDINLKSKSSVIISISRNKPDTLDVTKYFTEKVSSSPPDLLLDSIGVKNNMYEAQYFFKGCAGDLCNIMLIVQFKINNLDEIILQDIFRFDFLTNKKL